MSFASRSEPSKSTGPFQTEKDFIFSHIKGHKTTLLVRSDDIVGGRIIDLVDQFPLTYGWGGPNERRGNKVRKSSVLRNYCRTVLP